MSGAPPLRLAEESDLPRMLEIYAPYVRDTTVSFEYEPPDLAEFTRRFQSYTARFPWLTGEWEGRLVGYAYASPAFSRPAYRWDADLSVYLAPECAGQGLGRRFYAALLELLAAQGIRTVYGVVTGENAASLRFHEAVGFTEVCRFPKTGFKQGRWLDTVWFERELLPRTVVPEPPKSWWELSAETVEHALRGDSSCGLRALG